MTSRPALPSGAAPDGGRVPRRPIDSPEALRDLMGEGFTLSPEQWAAVAAPLEPAVVIAGAGSGKTSLMAARVVYLVANGLVRPDQVLGLTFTSKATAELAHRIREGLDRAGLLSVPGEDGELLEPTVSTYNAYAAGLLSEHGLLLGHEPDTRVIADGVRFQLAERAVQRHTGEVQELSDHPATVVQWLLGLEAAMSEHLVDVEQVRAFDRRAARAFTAALETARATALLHRTLGVIRRRGELLGLVEGYRRLKGQLGLMDFSDQVAMAAELVLAHPAVGRAQRESFRVVLLDEYQDTSVAQARMLAALFSGPEGGGLGHAVTAVGDPNQAIYGWRGASVSNILRFAEFFPPPSGGAPATYTLLTNRRSDRRILAVANALAEPLYAQLPDVQRLAAPSGAEAGEVHTIVHETASQELDWLPAAVVSAHDAMDRPSWREIGVLVRDNEHAARAFDALTARRIPVEIVGLTGLLRLPEVVEVVSTLTLVHDLAANAELITLLSGPRWAIGPRDLALLGRRARALAAQAPRADDEAPWEAVLEEAVTGADPVDVPALVDALDDPGDAEAFPYSAAARERFGLLAAELRDLRAHAAEPLLDLVRRVVDTIGIDVELASSVSPAAESRRDNLDLFLRAVADFTSIDGQVSLPALLAWITAEDDLGQGLDAATPSEADSVKLLTVHRSKGLEWDVVFLLGVCEERFPHTRARPMWVTGAGVLPAPLRGDALDLPQLGSHDKDGLDALARDARAHQETEERRLGYVALTRARHTLWVSSFLWAEGRKKPLGPSPYQVLVRDVAASWGATPVRWADRPDASVPNPLQEEVREVPWPLEVAGLEAQRRSEAAALVRAEDDHLGLDGWSALAERDEHDLDLTELALVQQWDDELGRLLAEARAGGGDVVEVPLPATLSATTLMRVRSEPDVVARELARPMPRPPAPAGHLGTRFHAWVESRFGQLGLLDVDELPDRADPHLSDIADEADLVELARRFEAGQFGERVPVAVEAAFSLSLAARSVRGRIDAVFAEDGPDGPGHLLVDWKTSRSHDADPVQLAIYRLAWSELQGVPLASVRAGFYYVRDDTLQVVPDLPSREDLEQVLLGTGTSLPG